MSNNTTLPFKVNITLPFGQLRPVVEWCTNHCSDNWVFDVNEEVSEKKMGNYNFSFKSEKDYITFLVFKR